MAFNVVSSLNHYFKAANCETFCQYFLRYQLTLLDKLGAKQVRDEIIEKMVNLLTKYRLQCSPNSAPS